MGFLARIFRRSTQPDTSVSSRGPVPEPASDLGAYVPEDGNRDRFIGPDGLPPLHLISDTMSDDESALWLCEDSTGLLVHPTDPRLAAAGIYVSRLRGEAFHHVACQSGDFRPGTPVSLVRELANEFDGTAVAVYDHTRQHLAGYVHKQQAPSLASLMDAGTPLHAISIRGAGPGSPCDQVTILAAPPPVLRRLLEPRPGHLPGPPAHRP